jgi:hypothetical protein
MPRYLGSCQCEEPNPGGSPEPSPQSRGIRGGRARDQRPEWFDTGEACGTAIPCPR